MFYFMCEQFSFYKLKQTTCLNLLQYVLIVFRTFNVLKIRLSFKHTILANSYLKNLNKNG